MNRPIWKPSKQLQNVGCDNYDSLKMDSTRILSIQNLIFGGVYHSPTPTPTPTYMETI